MCCEPLGSSGGKAEVNSEKVEVKSKEYRVRKKKGYVFSSLLLLTPHFLLLTSLKIGLILDRP